MPNNFFVGLFFVVSLIVTNTVRAADTPLDRYFAGLKTLTAQFEQRVENATLKGEQQASGRLVLQRPGKFFWDYQKPYKQQIVADGKKVWIYDSDLEQVTVKAFDSALGNTPALLLSSDQPLRNTFDVRELPVDSGMSVVELKPKDSEAGFTSVQIKFRANELAVMELKDSLGQITVLTFSSVIRNASVDAKQFDFNVPKGADIFDTTKE